MEREDIPNTDAELEAMIVPTLWTARDDAIVAQAELDDAMGLGSVSELPD